MQGTNALRNKPKEFPMRQILLICCLLLSLPVLAAEKVLFLMTAADSQILRNGKERQTGYFLNEFYEAYEAVKKSGFDVEFASPDGKSPTIDQESLKLRYWPSSEKLQEAKNSVLNLSNLESPLTIEEARKNFMDYNICIGYLTIKIIKINIFL
jgi:hypothetical protein